MTAAVQTIVALLVVALAAAWLVRRVLVLRRQSSCGEGCGAISSDARALRKKLRKGWDNSEIGPRGGPTSGREHQTTDEGRRS